jgi:hypothetical protein
LRKKKKRMSFTIVFAHENDDYVVDADVTDLVYDMVEETFRQVFGLGGQLRIGVWNGTAYQQVDSTRDLQRQVRNYLNNHNADEVVIRATRAARPRRSAR